MRFQPKSEDEVKRGELLVPGECEFEVRDAKDERSDKGNSMIHLILDCYDTNGDKAIVHDYLVESMPHKLRHFCYAAGIGQLYENGELEAANCIGCGGSCRIRTEQDKQKQYPPKNAVVDYIVPNGAKETPAYQQAKADHANKQAGVDSPKTTAWKSFCTLTSGLDGEGRTNAWREAITQAFGASANANNLTELQWKRFVAVVGSYKVGVGFPMALRHKDTPANPVEQQPVFAEDDIPF